MQQIRNLLLIGILVLVALSVIYLYSSHLPNLRDSRIYCESSECLEAAWRITAGLDLSTEPCDSFYQFSCANCAKNICHVEKGNEIEYLITEPIGDEEKQPLLSLKKLYQTCNNLTGENKEVDKGFWSLIKELGGWPILEGSKWKSFDLKGVILKCHSLGLPYKWIIGIGSGFYTWSEILEISAPISQNPFLKDPLTESRYVELIDKTAESMGASEAERLDVKEIVRFEKKVNQLTEKYKTWKHRPFRLRELKKIIPRIDLQELFQNVSENDIHDDSYIFSNYQFLKDLSLLLAGTSERTQANYFIWKIIQYFGIYLSDPIGRHFRNVLSTSDDRSRICTEDITSRFSHTVGVAYLKEYLDDKKHEEIKSIFDNVKQAFIKRIKNIYWIDPLFRDTIKNEIETISLWRHNDEIGIPDLNDELPPDSNSTNIINMIRQQNIYKWSHLLPSKRWTNYYSIDRRTGKPDYLFIDLKIVIPMPVILSQYYSSSKPNYLNYANLGVYFANILIRRYDIDTMAQHSYYDNDTISEYTARVDCINSQFNDYNDTDQTFEHFADVVAIGVAFEGYTRWVDTNGEEHVLPGLSFSPYQLFWLQATSRFCRSPLEDHDETFWRTKMESPLKHNSAYSEIFHCHLGSEMNPDWGRCSGFM